MRRIATLALMRCGRRVLTLVMCFAVFAPAVAHGATITFDTPGNLGGFTLGGNATQRDRDGDFDYFDPGGDGGHVYMEGYNTDDWLTYTAGSFTLNSFDLQAEPWDDYGMFNAVAAGGDIHLILRDLANNVLLDTILQANLSGGWTTEVFNIANVNQIFFERTDWNGSPGFWPRIDNLVINEAVQPAAVPEPTSLLLFGTGAAGLAAKMRRRKKEQVQ